MTGMVKINKRLFLNLIFILFLIVAIASLYDPSFLRKDVAQYLSTAQNIKNGNGIKTSILYYDEQLAHGVIPAPQTVFPFGYPFVIAIVSFFTNNFQLAAFTISLFSFLLSGFILYKILQTVQIEKKYLVLGTAFWYLLLYNWFITLVAASEMFYILLTLTAFYYFIRSDLKASYSLLMSGLFAALAVLVRYFGVFFIAVLSLFLIWEYIKNPRKDTIKRIVAFIFFPAFAVGFLFLRNYILCGSVKGGNNLERFISFRELLYQLYVSVSSLIGFSWNNLKEFHFFELSIILLIIVFLSLFVKKIIQKRSRMRFLADLFKERVVQTAVFYVAFSLIVLILLNKINPDIGITNRIILPLVPFGIIMFIFIMQGKLKHSFYSNVFVFTLFALFLLGQSNQTALIDKSNNTISAMVYAKVQDPALQQYWNKPNTIILSNEAQYLGGYLNTPVIGLADKEYTNTKWTEEGIKKLVGKFHIEQIVFFPNLFNIKAPKNNNQLFFKRLLLGMSFKWLQPVVLQNDIQIFRIKN